MVGWEWRCFVREKKGKEEPAAVKDGTENRADIYFPAGRTVGLKLRNGEGDLEIKLCHDATQEGELGAGFGKAELWTKSLHPECMTMSQGLVQVNLDKLQETLPKATEEAKEQLEKLVKKGQKKKDKKDKKDKEGKEEEKGEEKEEEKEAEPIVIEVSPVEITRMLPVRVHCEKSRIKHKSGETTEVTLTCYVDGFGDKPVLVERYTSYCVESKKAGDVGKKEMSEKLREATHIKEKLEDSAYEVLIMGYPEIADVVGRRAVERAESAGKAS
eukprot:Hpha_TRINITY_DN16809_c0_g3::TRINITY_DN16809_c0_g3_i1::g.151796::m.151796